MRRSFIILVSLFSFSSAALAKKKTAAADWSKEAVRMTGESDHIRERALARLAKMPHLREILRQEISGPKKALALDVISALNYQSLLPELRKAASNDETGFVFLTINNLMTNENRFDLVKFYKKQLLCKILCSISEPSKIVIIETLARLNEKLSLEELEGLYDESAWPEVKGAILDYVRYATVKHKNKSYAELLKKPFTENNLQLREQALSAISELPSKQREKLKLVKDMSAHTIADPQKIQVRVAFGYKDARPARFVGDRYERLSLIQSLLKECESVDDQACGFEREKENANIFSKTVKTVYDEKLPITIKVTASAAGPDDEDNRRNPYQKSLSKLSQENFLEGFVSAEAVFYVGHSRDGGGPDFNPPRLTKEKHVAYAWYKKNEPGLHLLLTQLKANVKQERSPFKLGLLSCASTSLFEKRIRAVTKKALPVTVPHLLYYSEAQELLLEELTRFVHGKINGSDLKN